jgi:hypothetical protein
VNGHLPPPEYGEYPGYGSARHESPDVGFHLWRALRYYPSDGQRRGLIILLKNVTNVPGENFNKAQTHRLAFDGDFREQFNDKLHGGNGSLVSPTGLEMENSTAALIHKIIQNASRRQLSEPRSLPM